MTAQKFEVGERVHVATKQVTKRNPGTWAKATVLSIARQSNFGGNGAEYIRVEFDLDENGRGTGPWGSKTDKVRNAKNAIRKEENFGEIEEALEERKIKVEEMKRRDNANVKRAETFLWNATRILSAKGREDALVDFLKAKFGEYSFRYIGETIESDGPEGLAGSAFLAKALRECGVESLDELLPEKVPA